MLFRSQDVVDSDAPEWRWQEHVCEESDERLSFRVSGSVARGGFAIGRRAIREEEREEVFVDIT